MDNYYYFRVSDGRLMGFIRLTRQEADLIERATNPSNWVQAQEDIYGMGFWIGADNPIPEEHYESGQYMKEIEDEDD